MNKSKFIFAMALLVACFLSVSNSFGQTRDQRGNEPNYEIILQTLIPTKDSVSESPLPANLSGTVKKLKETFAFSDYKLVSTHFGRTENGGNFNYKGITNSFDKQDNRPPVFNEWALNGLDKEGSSSNMVSFKSFRFGARIPVILSETGNETKSPVINYESVGITIQGFKVRENEPTVIGTLTLPDENQMAFIVITVKPVK